MISRRMDGEIVKVQDRAKEATEAVINDKLYSALFQHAAVKHFVLSLTVSDRVNDKIIQAG